MYLQNRQKEALTHWFNILADVRRIHIPSKILKYTSVCVDLEIYVVIIIILLHIFFFSSCPFLVDFVGVLLELFECLNYREQTSKKKEMKRGKNVWSLFEVHWTWCIVKWWYSKVIYYLRETLKGVWLFNRFCERDSVKNK